MLKKYFQLLLLFSFMITLPAFAQNEDDENDEDDEWDSGWNWDWDWDNDWWDWQHGKPLIELNYGLGEPGHDKLTNKLAKVGLVELKLGYASVYNLEEDGNVIEFNDKFSFASKAAVNLQSEKDGTNELESEMWRFGFGRRSGYGYDLETVRILPYAQNAAVWSQLEMKEYPVTESPLPGFPILVENITDTEILKRFDKSFRFGTLTEGGIRFEVGSLLSLNAGYEASVIFPRHMVWKHLGSLIIETAGLEALDNFIDEVIDSSPAAGPIVNFLLKNGFSYAFYTLKKEKMNWPFNTEAPLTYETFKFGVTFTF
ncbi:MAG: hypothetical protein AB1521_14935 [Bacteroidota bacterium]